MFHPCFVVVCWWSFRLYLQLSPPLFHVLKGNYAANIGLIYLLQHPFWQVSHSNSYFLFLKINLLFFFLQVFFNFFKLFVDTIDGFVHTIKLVSSFNCQSLTVLNIYFILFISVSKLCKQLNNIFTQSGDFDLCKKHPLFLIQWNCRDFHLAVSWEKLLPKLSYCCSTLSFFFQKIWQYPSLSNSKDKTSYNTKVYQSIYKALVSF